MLKTGDVFQVRSNGNNYCAIGSVKKKQSKTKMVIATKNGSIKLDGTPIKGKYNLYMFPVESIKRIHDKRKIKLKDIKKKPRKLVA